EDAKGSEQVGLRAQRDLREIVLHDHHTDVRHDQSNGVGGNQTPTATGNQTENVGKNQGAPIGANRTEPTPGARSVHAAGEQAELCAKKLIVRTEGASLQMDEEASLKGKRVLLNCKDPDPPEKKNDDGTPEDKRAFKVNLKDPDLQPYAKKHYALVVDGTK